MIRFLKRLLSIIISLFSLVLLVLIAAMLYDSWNTRYLRNDALFEGPQSFIIDHVQIIPMNQDTLLPQQSIWIEDGKIKALGNFEGEENIDRIDAEGAYLMPGLIDMHVHVWDEYELGLYLANGVTTIRNLWGQPMHLRMKKRLQNQDLIGPSFFTSGPKLTGEEFMGDDNLNLYSPEEAREKVLDHQSRGYDFIKTYYGLDEEAFEAILELAVEEGIEIAAHPSPKVSYDFHFHSQIKTLEHAEEIVQQPLNYELDSQKLKPIIEAYVNHPQTHLCPTLIVYHNILKQIIHPNILDSADLRYMNPMIRLADSKAQFNRWQGQQAADSNTVNYIANQHAFHLDILRRLHQSGVEIVCGTDAGIGVTLPGYSIHQELAFYQEVGLSNYEVLKTATLNPSHSHTFLSDYGSIEVGKFANLILLEANPLEDLNALREPKFLLVEGQRLDAAQLTSFAEHAKGRKNLLLSALRYLEFLLVEK